MGKSRQHNQAKFEKAMALLEEGFLPLGISIFLEISFSKKRFLQIRRVCSSAIFAINPNSTTKISADIFS